MPKTEHNSGYEVFFPIRITRDGRVHEGEKTPRIIRYFDVHIEDDMAVLRLKDIYNTVKWLMV